VGSYFAGTLSNLRIYNRMLNDYEVSSIHGYLKATLSSAGVALGSPVIVNPTSVARTPLVSFVYDDGNESDYTILASIFAAEGVPAGTAIITNQIGNAGRMTAGQIQTLGAAGWEIMSHSTNHIDLRTLDAAALAANLADSKAALEALGQTVTTMIYPGGANNATVQESTAQYYTAGRTVQVAENLVDGIPRKYGLAIRDITNINTDLATPQADVDALVTSKGWRIFYGHATTAAHAPNTQALIQYVKSKGIPIVTVRQALATLGY
jgi:peptidoglycan/xylan/chitin deacetylase (PgdA/CDA1 family)